MRGPLVAAALAALISCAPLQRVALKRCPTTIASLGDFVMATTALGVSVLAWNAGREARAVTFGGTAMLIAVASNEAECRR